MGARDLGGGPEETGKCPLQGLASGLGLGLGPKETSWCRESWPRADPEETSWCQGFWTGQGQILKEPVGARGLGQARGRSWRNWLLQIILASWGRRRYWKMGYAYLDPGSVWISLQNHDIFKNGKGSWFWKMHPYISDIGRWLKTSVGLILS